MPDPKPDQYAIPRLEKIKREGLGQTHAARAENGVTPPHVIPAAPAPEVLFNAAPGGIDFKAFVLARYERAIDEGIVYRPRRDQVLAIEGLLSASPEFFRPDEPGKAGAYTPKSVKVLRERGLKFLHDQYGDQLIRVELQLDEVTPHIQFAFFPIDKKGRWSAKNCMSRGLLSALWTRWAKVMADVGLQRGIAGSQAKHEPVKRYYAAINKFDAASVRAVEAIAIAPPELLAPSRSSLINPSDYITGVNQRLAAWGRKETKRILTLLEPLIAAAADAALTRRRSKQTRLTAEQQAKKITQLEKAAGDLREQLDKFEPVSVAAVVSKLGYEGTLAPQSYPNAIAYLGKLEGLDLDQSLGWLNSEFGPVATAATMAEIVREKGISTVSKLACPQILKHDDIKKGLEAQLSSLDADSFRLLGRKRSELSGKLSELLMPQKKSKIWTLADVLSSIGRLKKYAAENILRIHPVSSQYEYTLLSGLTTLPKFEALGVRPCNVLQARPGQFEAILRIPVDTDDPTKARALTKISDALGKKARGIDSENPLWLVGFLTDRAPAETANEAGSIYAVELIQAADVDFIEVSAKRLGMDGPKFGL